MLPLVAGGDRPGYDVGHLVVPRQWNRKQTLRPKRFAFDNGCYIGFNAGAIVRMLQAFYGVPGCLFAVAPDFVGDHASTRDAWPFWSRLIRALGLPPAFVIQEGCRAEDVPWDEVGAIFIGGEALAFKRGALVAGMCGYAKARGIHVHFGRLNGVKGYEAALEAGADTWDGSSLNWYPDTILPKATQEWPERVRQQPGLGL